MRTQSVAIKTGRALADAILMPLPYGYPSATLTATLTATLGPTRTNEYALMSACVCLLPCAQA